MPDVAEFVFPLPVNLANSRMHWRAKYAAKKSWMDRTDMLVLTKLIPSPPTEPWQKAVVTVHLAMGNTMDFDNMVARCKWAIDWLVTRGYLLNDNPKCLRWSAMPTQEIVRKPNTTYMLVTLQQE